jgi:hypothetical protein
MRKPCVQVYTELHEDGLSARIGPELLQQAIEAWERGVDFAPPSQFA